MISEPSKNNELEKYNVIIIKTMDSLDVSDFGAFVRGSVVNFTLYISPEAGVSNADMIIADSSGNAVFRDKMKLIANEPDGNLFDIKIDTGDIADKNGIGVYYYKFILTAKRGSLRIKRINDSSVIPALDTKADDFDDAFILTIYDSKYKRPEWLYGGIIYYIFVDRFHKEGQVVPRENMILNTDWKNGIPAYSEYPTAFSKNNVCFGGNLNGIKSKLEHISSLGVNCICLSPIFESDSNHKFDTADFMKIDEMFGGEAAFDALVKEAEKHGIRVIIDADFGISSDRSRYFNKYGTYEDTGAYTSKQSPYYSWYTFHDYPCSYDCRFSVPSLPRLNLHEQSYRNFITGERGVAANYIRRGACGFKLEMPHDIPRDMYRLIKQSVSAANPESVLYGCIKHCKVQDLCASNTYLTGDGLDSFANYPVREAIIRFLRQKDYILLKNTTELIYEIMPPEVSNLQMNLIGAHDTVRILTALAGEDGAGKYNAQLAAMKLSAKDRARGIKLQKLAYLICATLPGIPCVYYGDEAGLEGYSDPFNRRCFPWSDMEGKLLRFYKKVGATRRGMDIYKQGHFKVNFATEDMFIFSRVSDKEAAITAINRSDRTYRITSGTEFISLLTNVSEPTTCIDIPPLTGTVLFSKFGDGGDPADFAILRR